MKYAFWMIVAVLFTSVNALAQHDKNTYEKLARHFNEAGDVRNYLQKVWRCPEGVCPNINLAKELKRLRVSALNQCKTAWKKDLMKGERCRKVIETTPSVFSSPYVKPAVRKTDPVIIPYEPVQRAGPPKDPCETHVCANGFCKAEGGKAFCCCSNGYSGKNCQDSCNQHFCPDGKTKVDDPGKCPPSLQLTTKVFVCESDRKEVSDLNNCVKTDKRPRWVYALIAYSLLITIGWLRKRSKLGRSLKSLAELKEGLDRKGSIGAASFAEAVKDIVGTLPTLYASIPPEPSPPPPQAQTPDPKTPTGPPAPGDKPVSASPVPKTEGGTMLGVIDPNITLPPEPAVQAKQSPGPNGAVTPDGPRELPISPVPSPHEHTILGQPVMKPPDDKSGGK